jgi:prepilin-type N-terminal cleavage/methylation domain-containing protein/prepilin-type processing-associated H-X9-DG protein
MMLLVRREIRFRAPRGLPPRHDQNDMYVSLRGACKAPRAAFTLVELLVVITLVSMLASILLPAIHGAREGARRLMCLSNQRQIGVALHSYHSAKMAFPPGGVEIRTPLRPQGRQLSWSTFLLPHLEEAALFDRLDLDRPFDSQENAFPAATVLSIYLCPSIPQGSQLRSGRGPCHYGGIHGERIMGPNHPPKGVMLYDRSVAIHQIKDGTSRTLIVSEDCDFWEGQWINGRNVFDQAFAINAAPSFENDIRSKHPQGANALFCDGSARFLSEQIDLTTLAAICTCQGNEPNTVFE